MKLLSPRRARRQAGYMLLAVLLMLALMMIAAAAVAPKIAMQIKRQREEELIHRGFQYARAVKRFYRKFGRYPTRLEELDNTNNIRFLRKRYQDPITGKDEWTLVHFGEASAPLNSLQGAGRPNPLMNTGGATAASTGVPTGGAGGAGGPAQGTGGISIQAPVNSTVGTPVSQMTRPAGTGPGGSSSQSFGGGPIIGVASTSEAESLKEINETNHYNQWLFVYDARYDAGAQQALPGQGAQGAPGGPGGPQRPGLPGFGGPGVGPTPPPPTQTPRPPQ